jgi:hypothetical protein
MLGRDVRPTTDEPCRTPSHANGSAWQLAEVTIRGERLAPSYFCNVFAGGTGSLDFSLGKAYRLLTVTIGLAEERSSSAHRVRFEVIGDGVTYLTAPRILRFGESQRLVVDVTSASRLTLRITELGEPVGSGAASQPAWARPLLTPVG